MIDVSGPVGYLSNMVSNETTKGNTMTKHNVTVSSDSEEGAEFVAWLNAAGHDAELGNSTGNYVDGLWTLKDIGACETMRTLWTDYCNSV